MSYNFVNENGQKIEGWENLVRQIVENVEGWENLKLPVEEDEPYKELEQIEKQMRERDNYDKVKRDTFAYLTKFYTLPAYTNNYNLHKKLCRLSNKIVTTNYDNAFERADNIFNYPTAYRLTTPLTVFSVL